MTNENFNDTGSDLENPMIARWDMHRSQSAFNHVMGYLSAHSELLLALLRHVEADDALTEEIAETLNRTRRKLSESVNRGPLHDPTMREVMMHKERELTRLVDVLLDQLED